MEFTATEADKNHIMGLSHGDPGQSYSDIDYALYLYYQNGTLYVFENGVNKGQVGT